MIRTTRLSGNAAKIVEYMQDKLSEREITRGEHAGEKIVEGYYSNKGAPAEWFGKGAEAQGLSGEVNAKDMQAALAGIVKHTGEDLSRRGGQTAETRRLGEDWTISAPKSVSIMSVEDPRIAEAHTSAARAALSYIESEMAYGRMGKGGNKGNDFSGNITAALYLHEDSRPDAETGRVSPHLHTHAIIANMIQRSDKTWGSMKIDWGHHNEKKLAADAVYKSALASELQKLGYEIERGRGVDFEIKGITREQIEHFSPRSEAIKKEIGGECGDVSAKEREAAQNKTRQQKSALSQTEQRFQWREEFRSKNMDLSALRKAADQRAARGEAGRSKVTPDLALQSALHHLSERNATFSEHELRKEALAAGLGDASPAQIERAIEKRAAGLVGAGEGKGLKTTNFTTKSAVLRESAILARASDGKGKAEALFSQDSTVVPVVPSFTEKELIDGKRGFKQRAVSYIEKAQSLTQHVLRRLSERNLDADAQRENSDVLSSNASVDRSRDADLRRDVDRLEQPRVAQVEGVIKEREAKQGFRFSDGQSDGVRLALTSQDQHIGIVGAAGAGKTTSMSCIVEQYKAAGYEVIGVAPSAAAAHELKSAGCDETKTLASLLKEKPKEGEGPGKQKLYVLDEAGMVSSKDYDAFFKKADKEGARTLSVGDPLQLQSVEAGSAFKQLLDSGNLDHVKIDEIQRQKDPQLKELAQAFAAGDAAKGVELAKPYMTQVQVEQGRDKADALSRAAANAYLSLSQEGRQKTLLLAGTNKTRQLINEKIRDGLVKEGTLSDRATTITALDKLDLTREQATQAENYSSKAGQRVIVQFGTDYKEKDATGQRQTLASKGSQFEVTGTKDGKLRLQSIDDPEKQIEVNPAKIKGLQAFSARDMELRDGDQIMFRQNDKAKGVINGMQGTVSIDEHGSVKVKTASGQEIPLPQNSGHVIDYSYARTVHSSQGATVERAIVVGEAGRVATAESAYVACSREKHGLQIITDDSEKLGKSWEKFSDRQHAKDAARESFQAPDSLQEIQLARAQAGLEAGDLGDLALARAGGVQAAVDQAKEEQEQQKSGPEAGRSGSESGEGNVEGEGKEGQEAEQEQEAAHVEIEISM